MPEMPQELRVHLRQKGPIPLDTDMACRPGELVALVGPSGSGKSTILRSIAGLHRPHYGRVSCGDQIWLDTERGADLPPQRRSVGLVFQQYALFPHMTALENIVAALGHRPRDARLAEGLRLLGLVHLAGLEHRRPAELSGGQQQRVAVARALARNPSVLLLDEPFSAVDQVTRRKLQRELVQLRQRLRLPIVLVTHDLEEASLLADRMCILHHGRIVQDGDPFRVMARPSSALVARLVGLRNIFQGRILERPAESGLALLGWMDYRLEVRDAPDMPPGTPVDWVIPPANVVLHRRNRPSRGDHENPVAGTISELVRLGETTSVVIQVDDRDDCPLSMSVPTHVAERNQLAVGERAKASLLSNSIHLMPCEPEERA